MEAAPTFGPFQRVSNMVFWIARGALPKEGSLERSDGHHLKYFLCDMYGVVSTLVEKTVE